MYTVNVDGFFEFETREEAIAFFDSLNERVKNFCGHCLLSDDDELLARFYGDILPF